MHSLLGHWVWFALLILNLAASPACFGSGTNQTSAADFQITTWNTSHGLPHPSVLALAQTPDGYLWCGTRAGLARFDGVRFTVFDSQTTPELGNAQIRALFVDGSGTLWITTRDARLVRFRDHAFTAYLPPRRDSLGQSILNLAEDNEGALWLMPQDLEVMRFSGGAFDHDAKLWPGGPANSNIRQGIAGDIWMSSADTLALRRNGVTQILLRGQHEFHCPSRTGGYWTSKEGQIGIWHDNHWLWNGPIKAWIRRTYFEWSVEDHQMRLWLASLGEGLFCYGTNGMSLEFTVRQGLPSNYIRFLLPDREDNVWVATENGLSRIRPALLQVYDRRHGLKGERIMGTYPSSDGGLWAATDGGGVHKWQDGIFMPVTNGPASTLLNTVLVDRSSNVWIATHGNGLHRSKGEAFTRVEVPSLAPEISALFQDSTGSLWVGQRSLNHVLQLTNQAWFILTLPNPESMADVRCFAEDDTGGLWLGTAGSGLFHWDDNRFERFSRTNGLPSDSIWTLHFDREDHSLWIGASGGGLVRRKAGRFDLCNSSHGFWDNTIYQMFDDGRGWFWFGSRRGIFRVSKAGLYRFLNGEMSRIHSVAYGEADGMPTMMCSGGFQPAGCRTPDGKLWFPTTQGLVCLDPAAISTNPYPPVVHIERVLLDNKDVHGAFTRGVISGGTPAFEIPPGAHRCEFQYTGLSFTAPHAVQFRYRLEGLEADWTEAGTARSATYSQLLPGDYRFQVSAANRDGIWNETRAALPFRVLPAFWQTQWFFAVCLGTGMILLVGTGWIAARSRARRRMAKLALANALECERTRIARDMHDELGAGLTQISLLSALARDSAAHAEEIRAGNSRIEGLSRDLVRSLDEIVWAVRPQNDNLASLVEYLGCASRDLCEGSSVRCWFSGLSPLPDMMMPANIRHNLLLACREAINNVIKHSRATEVRVRLEMSESDLTVKIADNGRGFDDGKENAKRSGLTHIRERLAEIGGRCEVRSELGRGTVIQLLLPLNLPTRYDPSQEGSRH